MTRISPKTLTGSIKSVDVMTTTQRQALFDEIMKYQPTLGNSVLFLNRVGVSHERLEMPIKVLLVIYQAMKDSLLKWPVITESDLQHQLQRWIETLKKMDGAGNSQRKYQTQIYIDAHSEKIVMAYVMEQINMWQKNQKQLESDRFVIMNLQTLVNVVAYVDLKS